MSGATVSPLNSDVFTALKAFIVAVLGIAPAQVVQGLGNGVAMPTGGFVVITILNQMRLRTNVDTWDQILSPTSWSAEQGVELSIQMDVYGASAPDWSIMLSTLFRDEYANLTLAPNCVPLYCEDPRMMPLVNAEAAFEQRFMIDCKIQYNPVTVTPQDFADTLGPVTLINADEAYQA